MLTTYEEESGFRPEHESDVMLRMRTLAGEVYRERTYAEYMMRQMFPTTATGEYLDAHAAQRGLVRKNATYAAGTVIFTAALDEHEDILIPAGTVVCTAEDLRRFVTNSDAVLTTGSSHITVAVTAEQPGSAYNIASGKIGIMVTPVMGIAGVKNTSKFTGGTDEESDEQLRERIADSYRNITNGANAAYYRSIALSVDGVYSASAVGRARGTGTVNVYVCGISGSISADKLSEVQALLDEKRELNVDVKAYQASKVDIDLYIRLTVKDGYSFNDTAAQVQTAVTAYLNSLGVGQDVWLSDVGEVIYHIEGVAGYKFLESFGSDREIQPHQYASARTILVRAD